MKMLRHTASLAFVLGLFTAVFAGIPWHVIVADDGGWLTCNPTSSSSSGERDSITVS